jgi:hypothetical protein
MSDNKGEIAAQNDSSTPSSNVAIGEAAEICDLAAIEDRVTESAENVARHAATSSYML